MLGARALRGAQLIRRPRNRKIGDECVEVTEDAGLRGASDALIEFIEGEAAVSGGIAEGVDDRLTLGMPDPDSCDRIFTCDSRTHPATSARVPRQ
nr:hypothetical protein [Brevibacterium gallinarum]